MYTISMCIYTYYSSPIVPSTPFSVFRQSKEKTHTQRRKKMRNLRKSQNLYSKTKLNFWTPQCLSTFFSILLEVPSFQRAPVLPEWWLPDVSVLAEHLPSLLILGNVGPMSLHFSGCQSLVRSWRKVCICIGFTYLSRFPILRITLFLCERLNFWCSNIHPHKNEGSIHFKSESHLVIDEGTIFWGSLKTTRGHTWVSSFSFSSFLFFLICFFVFWCLYSWIFDTTRQLNFMGGRYCKITAFNVWTDLVILNTYFPVKIYGVPRIRNDAGLHNLANLQCIILVTNKRN